MPQEIKTKEYWDSLTEVFYRRYDSVSKAQQASSETYQKWADSMEALNGGNSYQPEKELFAHDAQFILIPLMVTLFIGLIIFGIILFVDGHQAEKSKNRRSNSILDYKNDED